MPRANGGPSMRAVPVDIPSAPSFKGGECRLLQASNLRTRIRSRLTFQAAMRVCGLCGQIGGSFARSRWSAPSGRGSTVQVPPSSAARSRIETGAADRRASLRTSGRAAVARDGRARAWAHPRAGALAAGAGAEAARGGAGRPRSGADCCGWHGADARGGASAGVRPPGRRRTGLTSG
jgi:hypothetical protein